MLRKTLLSLVATTTLMAAPAAAETVEVQMLNRASDGRAMMVFEPAVVEIAPGDTVRFVAADPSHNAESIPGMMPEGAETFRTPFNKTAEVTFDVPGVYGYKCLPHYALGMVGVIKVGDATAPEAVAAAAEKAPKRAADRFAGYLDDL